MMAIKGMQLTVGLKTMRALRDKLVYTTHSDQLAQLERDILEVELEGWKIKTYRHTQDYDIVDLLIFFELV